MAQWQDDSSLEAHRLKTNELSNLYLWKTISCWLIFFIILWRSIVHLLSLIAHTYTHTHSLPSLHHFMRPFVRWPLSLCGQAFCHPDCVAMLCSSKGRGRRWIFTDPCLQLRLWIESKECPGPAPISTAHISCTQTHSIFTRTKSNPDW